ncbi:MAG: dihydrolipoyl dehydrogenase [Pygmaiobacter massiliensis]|nr:dihydrolipoyl dehydrogenase [Pygmaiobacter massiliensis]
MERFDLVVIGAGPGGYVAALEAARLGMRVAVAEKDALGGTCLNRGCIPTKTMLHTAQLAEEAAAGGEIGLCTGPVTVDLEKLQQYKNQVTSRLSEGIGQLFAKQKVTLFKGTACVEGTKTVRVYGQEQPDTLLEAEHILVATGGCPARLPVEGVDLPGVYTSDGMLFESRRFEQMVIVGGGVIGMEFASLYSALGCKVTVLEAAGSILANLDREFGQNLKMILKKRGVDIHTGAQLSAIRQADGKLCCVYEEKGAQKQAPADAVLVAVGRRPETAGLFAEPFTPAMERGRILVDEDYRTSLPGVWAIGDAIGGMQLAHLASAQGVNAVHRMLGRPAPMRTDLIPSCVYTSPEIASVGLTADEAKQKGIAVTVHKYPMSANGKTVLTRQERSFMKLVAEENTGRVLGAQLMCDRATDMIGEFATAIANKLTVEQLGCVVRPHPTYNEAVWELTRG